MFAVPCQVRSTGRRRPHGATLNSTRRSSASLASSLPVPTTISRDPLPVAISRPAKGMLLVLQTVLDVVGAQAGQAIVDRRKPGGAGVADHFEAALLGRGPLRELFEPGIVGRADAPVVDELGRARLEQEFDRELVALQPVIDHLAEGVHRGAGAAQPVIGEIDAVEHAQLLAARRLQRALIDVERIAIAALVVGFDAVIDQRGHHDAVGIGLIDIVADLGALAGLDVAVGRGILGEHRAVGKEGRRRRVDAFRQRARHALGDDRPRPHVGERETDAIGILRTVGDAGIVHRGEGADQHDRRLGDGRRRRSARPGTADSCSSRVP